MQFELAAAYPFCNPADGLGITWTQRLQDNGVHEKFMSFFFFCVPQLYLWGSPLLGEIFAYVTVF